MAQLEPWEKVYIRLAGSQTIEDLDEHLKYLSCVDCHEGNNKAPNNMEVAHEGLVLDPSEILNNGKNTCGESDCHESIAGSFKNSLHLQQWGYKKWLALRSGVDEFEQCPQSTKDGFASECTDCHATCGDCHIAVPNSAGGGFPKFKYHRFFKTPDQENNCTACHGTRVGHDFEGDYDIFPPRPEDVHAEMGFTCMNCHDQTEMHSAAPQNKDRYEYELLPSCEDGCHTEDLSTANTYHSTHFDDMSCYVCHSQPYNNCTSCHVEGQWQTDPNYTVTENFKIGLNPRKTESGRFRHKFATLRRIPIDRDSYENWGPASADLPAYDDYPTWKYTTPHSIRKYTARTDTSGGVQCWESCHTKEGFGNRENLKYYLFADDVDEDEKKANESVVVDGHLPDGWE
ncbi:MAG: hypothetical protein GF313_01385 [Caldithrix sp.]|nr:hypothetical protein [Caldithrix sp.]